MAAPFLTASAAEPAANDTPLELPKFTVNDPRELLPLEEWRYARVPGLEILSQASDGETQKLLRDFQLFDEALDVVWPALKGARPVPLSLLVCGEGKFTAFTPARGHGLGSSSASILLADREQSAIVLNFAVKSYGSTGPFSLAVDHYARLNHEYARLLLGRRQPRLPAWLEEGLAQLLMDMQVDNRFIEFGRIVDPNLAPILLKLHDPNQPFIPGMIPVDPPDFNRRLLGQAAMPLAQFFAVSYNSPLFLNPTLGRWGTQAKGLVHMWLYGENGRYNQSFARFAARATTEPVTEAMFKECFGMGYTAMLGVFTTYVRDTTYRYQQFQSPKGRGLPEPAPLVLRDATPAEIGRLKGEAQLLAGHPDAAREEFIAPYLRGQADAALLASLGLFENRRGETARAKQFLAAAVRQQVVRPRAYVELAQLSLAEALHPPVGPDPETLHEDQALAITALLRTARQQPPPLAETYELLAEILQHRATPPGKSDLGMLNQGVLLFQDHPLLLLRAAELNGKYGDPAEARTMAEFGVKLSRTPEARQAFVDVLASLPPAKAR